MIPLTALWSFAKQHKILGLTLTASTEAQIANATRSRPDSSSSTLSHSGLLDNTPGLVQSIDQEKTYLEDAFQATVCLHHIYFLRNEWKTVTAGLDVDKWGEQAAQFAQSRSGVSPWTRICMIKSRYIVGLAQEKLGAPQSAADTYQSALTIIEEAPSDVASSPQYRMWAGGVLARGCALSTRTEDQATLQGLSRSLALFRTWGRYSGRKPGNMAPGNSTQNDIPPRKTWSQYYQLLSMILRHDLVYPVDSMSELSINAGNVHADYLCRSRIQFVNDLKDVEATYETLLLQETKFPKASQSNEEVELWVQQVVANWRILCGPGWRDEDLGTDGKEAVGRRVLDILYRAATKTFHSTPILRHLFTVHASLAEFELAMKAFDSYTEIIGKGKARAEKTGLHELGLDNDDILIFTAAQAIKVLCLYGSRAEGERALAVGKKIEAWLTKQRPVSSSTVDIKGDAVESGRALTQDVVSTAALAAAYRAIGQSQANWARLTFEPTERSLLQNKALRVLRRSLVASPEGDGDLDTAYSLALVLAETRDVPAAIQVLRTALAASPSRSDTAEVHEADNIAATNLTQASRLDRERRGFPLWHLLALLLTARGEFETAVKLCDAALEQFDTLSTAGTDVDEASINGDNTLLFQNSAVGRMTASEKEGVLQIKLTQSSLLELLDSPTAAIDESKKLLALYARLFGAPSMAQFPTKAPPTAVSRAPQESSGGTLKSIRGSVLGRSKASRPTIPLESAGTSIRTSTDVAHSTGQPVTIQVTNEDGKPADHHESHHHLRMPFKVRGHHGDWRDAGNLKQPDEKDGRLPPVPPQDGHSGAASSILNEKSSSAQQPLRPIAHNMEMNKQPAPLQQHQQPPRQDLRLPAPHPASASWTPGPQFPTAIQRRHKISLLIDVWLYIAGLYIRTELFADARGAIEEAHKLIEGFELEVAQEASNARAFDERGWGNGKSVSHLWGDVWAEVSCVAVIALVSIPNIIIARQACSSPESTLRCIGRLRAIPLQPTRSSGSHYRHLLYPA